MHRKKYLLLGTILAMIFSAASAHTQDVNDPKTTVNALLGAVKILSTEKETGANQKAVQTISQSFDLPGISKACLKKTWDGLSKEEQTKFVNLFQEVLEKVAYPKSAKFFKNTEVEIEEVKTNSGRSEVMTLVVHPEEGEVEVAYCLEQMNGQWLIKDILLDGVSLQIDLRSQMQKILREESYKELKRRLRDKLPK